MGFLGRMATGEAKFRPIELPELGKAPSYASLSARPDGTTSILRNNIQVVLKDIAGQHVAGAALTSARSFLMNQGIDPIDDSNASLTESIDQSAQMGALLAEIEERARYRQAGQIEYEHAKLYAMLRSRAIQSDTLGNGWNAFVFDVSYYCHRMNVTSDRFYGPFHEERFR